MKTIQLINDDYLGHVEHLRHACREYAALKEYKELKSGENQDGT